MLEVRRPRRRRCGCCGLAKAGQRRRLTSPRLTRAAPAPPQPRAKGTGRGWHATARTRRCACARRWRSIAPGTALRDGLERILRGRTGALIVLGHDQIVESICTGGFTLDVPFTATGLRELAKMDGAIIVDRDITRITRAAVHLMPDPSIPSEETGTRHRTADRVARQTGFPVISVSQSMQIIAAYVGETRHVIEGSAQILSRANQALATLERYKLRLDEVSATLSALEIEDLVTVRDVAVVAQRLEMVIRIAREIEDYVLELGTDGRLLSLQLEELVTGVDQERELVVRDYLPSGRRSKGPEATLARLEALSSIDLVDPASASRALGLGEHLDGAVAPRGYRLLAKVPRLPADGGRAAGRALRHPAEAALRRRRRPPGRRRRRRAAGPQRPRGSVPPRGVVDPRALRLTSGLGGAEAVWSSARGHASAGTRDRRPRPDQAPPAAPPASAEPRPSGPQHAGTRQRARVTVPVARRSSRARQGFRTARMVGLLSALQPGMCRTTA